MTSVPRRGSGWVQRLPIVELRLRIGLWRDRQSAFGNLELAIDGPTRYRVVVPDLMGPRVE
jgi:hypothetical protein